MSCCTAEDQAKRLFEATSPVQPSAVEELFNQLQPIKPSFLIGEWDGNSLDTGHPGLKLLQAMRWAGKTFRSVDDADPIVTLDDAGNRIWKEEYGNAVVREMAFRGVVSAAMIYDTKPIMDHFRYVDEKTVLGVMETPKQAGSGTFYFYLQRRASV
ncbi:hypothetical protein ASPWEDRAFT_586207 [Aspergillus wentii DTO 134E9]|uniref:GXWXG domain-containing protein n=1 Tax=Aspergillus wentii DTO 134E9 TaxID=1073089 RepID=A0A1L9RI43_ASPWE|nr:uncharacterized protein ASPWEDRAFT_586207 [Aspergillus wentii DTO 134E9]KAI9925908.1 hypothetical protein MW887_005714 [Aspergillus wentii]OJJ34591.1 hypothetical protein ASPWEDRAFT_586207 [Aspergillus wentii DTO 134E9]